MIYDSGFLLKVANLPAKILLIIRMVLKVGNLVFGQIKNHKS